jgi:hypothetical protein
VTTVTKKNATAKEAASDSFVPDRQVRAELCIAPMTMWRWDRDPAMAALGWPPPMRTRPNAHKKRSHSRLEQFKANMLQRAIAARGGEAA